jgi:hypothetical protein
MNFKKIFVLAMALAVFVVNPSAAVEDDNYTVLTGSKYYSEYVFLVNQDRTYKRVWNEDPGFGGFMILAPSVSPSPDGVAAFVFNTKGNSKLVLVRLDSKYVIASVDVPYPTGEIKWSMDGKYLAFRTYFNRTMVIYNLAGELKVEFPVEDAWGDAEWIEEGLLYTDAGKLYLVDVEGLSKRFYLGVDGVKQIEFSSSLGIVYQVGDCIYTRQISVCPSGSGNFQVSGDLLVVHDRDELEAYNLSSGLRIWSVNVPSVTVFTLVKEYLVYSTGGSVLTWVNREGQVVFSTRSLYLDSYDPWDELRYIVPVY